MTSCNVSQSVRFRLYSRMNDTTSTIPSLSLPPFAANIIGRRVFVRTRGKYSSRTWLLVAAHGAWQQKWLDNSWHTLFTFDLLDIFPSSAGKRWKLRSFCETERTSRLPETIDEGNTELDIVATGNNPHLWSTYTALLMISASDILHADAANNSSRFSSLWAILGRIFT